MKHQEILNLLNESGNSKYARRNRKIVNVQSNAYYSAGKEIIQSTGVVNSNLCDYNVAQILVGGNITTAGNIAARIAFKNCAPFINYISKIE